jgi:hypothetical protein
MRKLLALTMLGLVASLALLAFGAHTTFADQRNFHLHNRSQATITHVYISPEDSDSWGADVLGDGVVRPGYYTDVVFSPSTYQGDCKFDLRIESNDGRHMTMWGVNLCTTADIWYR